jgi:hypothetical protein
MEYAGPSDCTVAPVRYAKDMMRRDRLTDLHMLVLAWFRFGPGGDAEEAAVALDLRVAVVDALCADLEAAGCIVKPTVH